MKNQQLVDFDTTVQKSNLVSFIKEASKPFGYPRKVAEIGVFEGAMSKAIIRRFPAIEQYWGIDPYKIYEKSGGHNINARIKTQEEWENLYMTVTIKMRQYPQFRLLRVSSKDAVNCFPDEFFDVVFIDGNHLYEYVKTDIECWLPKVKKKGGICGHDYGVARLPGVKKAVDELIPDAVIYEDIATWLHIVK